MCGVPLLREAVQYRTSGAKLVGSMAETSSEQENSPKRLENSREAFWRIAGLSFGLATGLCCSEHLETWKASPLAPRSEEKQAQRSLKVVAFHVAAVATMCLVQGEKAKVRFPKLLPKRLQTSR